MVRRLSTDLVRESAGSLPGKKRIDYIDLTLFALVLLFTCIFYVCIFDQRHVDGMPQKLFT